MMEVIRLPKMGLTMEDAKIERWIAKPGDTLKKGDVLLEVETDKALLEVEMPIDGTIDQLLVEEGDSVTVGAEIARVRNDHQLLIRISPSARRKARELGIDYTTMTGTGPGGRIIHQDIIDFHERSGQQSPPEILENESVSDGRKIPLSSIRQTIARRMVESVTTIPQFQIKRRVDVQKLMQLKKTVEKSAEKSRGIKISFNDFLIRAVAEALAAHPQMNASFFGKAEDSESYIVHHEMINIGLAVATDAGLKVPVIRQADRLSVVEIARQRRELMEKTRQSKLNMDESQGGTFTISNLGSMNIEEFTAIINPPEAGILAVGKVRDEVLVIDGSIEIRPVVTLVGSFDHRVVDGADAAKFMEKISEQLQSDMWFLF